MNTSESPAPRPNRFDSKWTGPRVHSTVDFIAVRDARRQELDPHPFGYEVLLGWKAKDVLLHKTAHQAYAYRLVGGFMDATDLSVRAAGFRECREETGLDFSLEGQAHVLGAVRVFDSRAELVGDALFTNLVVARENPKVRVWQGPDWVPCGQDDLLGAAWVPVVPQTIGEPSTHPLVVKACHVVPLYLALKYLLVGQNLVTTYEATAALTQHLRQRAQLEYNIISAPENLND